MTEFKETLKADVTGENGLTDKENKFLEVLFDEAKGNVKEAMKLAGLAGPTTVITKRLAKQIKELSQEYLVASTARAAVSLVTVLDDPSIPGTSMTIKASQEILDRGGVTKKEEAVVQEQNFMFILPAKDDKSDPQQGN